MVAEEYRLLVKRLDDDVLRKVAILRMEGYDGRNPGVAQGRRGVAEGAPGSGK